MTLVRDLLFARARELHESGDHVEAKRLERLLRDAHEAEQLALTGDGLLRSTDDERQQEVA